MWSRASLVLVLALAVGLTLVAIRPAPAAAAGVAPSCRAAAVLAERRHGLPAGLLEAIALVESGRSAEPSEASVAWPWTVNAGGRGKFFPSQAEAIAEVAALQRRGVQSIDVGCMQVNLMHHPDAFADLPTALAPETNADYAARFLKSLQAETGDWREAIGRYHSSAPDRKRAYLAKVLARWTDTRAAAGREVAWAAPLGPREAEAYRRTRVADYLARRAMRVAFD